MGDGVYCRICVNQQNFWLKVQGRIRLRVGLSAVYRDVKGAQQKVYAITLFEP